MSENDLSANESDARSEWIERLQRVDSVEDATNFLSSLHSSQSDIDVSLMLELSRYALGHAVDLAVNSADEAKKLIFKFVLPICEGKLSCSSREKSQHREMLASWLEKLPQSQMIELRADVLRRVGSTLAIEPNEDLLWTIASIGYRDESLTKIVREVFETNKELSEPALSVLIGLGVPPEMREAIFSSVEVQVKKGNDSHPVMIAIQELVGPERLDLGIDLLKNYVPEEADKVFGMAGVASVVTRALSRAPSKLEMHQQCWNILRKHKNIIQMTPELAFRCNSGQVLKDILSWLTDKDLENEIVWYRLLSAIDRMVAPQQLDAWESIDSDLLAEFLEPIAIKDTGNDGNFVTTALSVKRGAWETALSFACSIDDWIEPAMTSETGPTTVHEIAGIAACADIGHLPKSVLNVITKADTNTADREAFFRKTGVMEVARSCGDWESLVALLNFTYTHNGSVLFSTIDAITDAALEQMKSNPDSVVDLLLKKTGKENEAHHREAAISVICDFCRSGFVAADEISNLWEFVISKDLCEYARKDALATIGNSEFEVSPEQVDYLVRLAQEDESDVGWRACEALIRRNLIDVPKTNWILRRLGLKSQDSFRFESPSDLTGWQSFILSILFENDSLTYSAAVCDLVEMAAIDVVYQMLGALRRVGRSTSDDIAASFFDRILKSNNQAVAETEFFSVLGSIAPSRLKTLTELDESKTWLVEGRVALCESIRRLDKFSRDEFDVASALMKFTTDPAFQVRRSAYRAMSEIAPDELKLACNLWSGTTEIELRKRAAEAIAWLPESVVREIRPDFYSLSWDPEKSVRNVFSKGQEMKKKRLLAKDYWQIVESACSPRNRDISWYRYARALTNVGDDDTIYCLEELAKAWQLSANVKHCLRKTLKELKANWKQVTEKWPEPWSHETGLIEQFDGFIELRDKKVSAKFSLWCKHRASQSELSDWGGVAEEIQDSGFAFFDLRKITIHLPERPSFEADVYQSSSSSSGTSRIVFRSNTPYPKSNRRTIRSDSSLVDSVANLIEGAGFGLSDRESDSFSAGLQPLLERADAGSLGFQQEKGIEMKKLVCQEALLIGKFILVTLPNSAASDFFVWQVLSLILEREDLDLRLSNKELQKFTASLRSSDNEEEIVSWLVDRVKHQLAIEERQHKTK